MRYWLLAMIGFALAAKSYADEESVEFKGLKFGSEVSALSEKYAYSNCSANPLISAYCEIFSDQKCMKTGNYVSCSDSARKDSSYAGVLSDILLIYSSNRFESAIVTFPNSNFQMVVDSITAKYGNSRNTRKSIVQNNSGAMFENKIYEWKIKDILITAEKYGSKIDEGDVVYVTDRYIEKKKKERSEISKKAIDDM